MRRHAETLASPVTDLDPAEILRGLNGSPKRLPARCFYDAAGSRLFEDITRLPEYYPTRTEISILAARASDLARLAGPRAGLIEYGSGSSRKTRILLDALKDPAWYAPIDISAAALDDAVESLSAEYPGLSLFPLRADYAQLEEFPFEDLGDPGDHGDRGGPARRILFFPGSTIGNLHPGEALDLLRRMRRLAGEDGALVLGVDLRKPREKVEAAYNDAAGVTAAFNLNILRRLNRELGADFPVDAFRHRAFLNEDNPEGVARIEMHLVATRYLNATVAGHEVAFSRGECIHTENSYKYEAETFASMLEEAGFGGIRRWTDAKGWFGVFFAENGGQ